MPKNDMINVMYFCLDEVLLSKNSMLPRLVAVKYLNQNRISSKRIAYN